MPTKLPPPKKFRVERLTKEEEELLERSDSATPLRNSTDQIQGALSRAPSVPLNPTPPIRAGSVTPLAVTPSMPASSTASSPTTSASLTPTSKTAAARTPFLNPLPSPRLSSGATSPAPTFFAASASPPTVAQNEALLKPVPQPASPQILPKLSTITESPERPKQPSSESNSSSSSAPSAFTSPKKKVVNRQIFPEVQIEPGLVEIQKDHLKSLHGESPDLNAVSAQNPDQSVILKMLKKLSKILDQHSALDLETFSPPQLTEAQRSVLLERINLYHMVDAKFKYSQIILESQFKASNLGPQYVEDLAHAKELMGNWRQTHQNIRQSHEQEIIAANECLKLVSQIIEKQTTSFDPNLHKALETTLSFLQDFYSSTEDVMKSIVTEEVEEILEDQFQVAAAFNTTAQDIYPLYPVDLKNKIDTLSELRQKLDSSVEVTPKPGMK